MQNAQRLKTIPVLRLIVCLLLTLSLGFPVGQAQALELFSSGMLTPETISPVPAGVYNNIFSGYFVPDPGRVTGSTDSKVWIVPLNGGTPTRFAPTTIPMNASTVGGLFLPSGSYWGSYGGKYLTVGWETVNTVNHGRVNIYNEDGTYTTVWEAVGHLPKTAALAPANWGAFSNQLIITDGGPPVYALDKNFNQTTVPGSNIIPETARFGLAFAPDNWGAVGGDLLTNRGSNGLIFAIDSSGSESIWTNIALEAGQNGLRQMAFSPAGWLTPEPSLLVSVSGSFSGGGNLGDVLALNSQGQVIYSLKDNLGLTKFDPRGLYFRDDGKLIISDASDPIYLATQADFSPVPLPGSLMLLASGLLGLVGWKRIRKG
jgi:hypothetical protein